MASGYGQKDCPVASALDVIGEKWTLLVLRDLFRKGPLHFQELERGLRGVAPNTLSANPSKKAGVSSPRVYTRATRPAMSITSPKRARRSAQYSRRSMAGASAMGNDHRISH